MAHNNDLDPDLDNTHVKSTDHTEKTDNSSNFDDVQSADSAIMHPHGSDLARRRLLQQKSPDQYRKSHDEESIEDGSNNLMSQLSALNMGKGPNYENVNDVPDERDIERLAAFRSLHTPGNVSSKYGPVMSEEGHQRSRTSISDRPFADREETDIKTRLSVASSQVSEQSHHSYNKLTGSLKEVNN